MSVSRAAAPTAPQVLRLQRQERPQCWGLQAGALARWSPAVPSGASLPAAVWPLSEAALMAAFQRDCPLNTLVRMQSCSDTRGAGGGPGLSTQVCGGTAPSGSPATLVGVACRRLACAARHHTEPAVSLRPSTQVV